VFFAAIVSQTPAETGIYSKHASNPSAGAVFEGTCLKKRAIIGSSANAILSVVTHG
jgi:hypothetical protein